MDSIKIKLLQSGDVKDLVQNSLFPVVNSYLSLKTEVGEECRLIQCENNIQIIFRQSFDRLLIGIGKTHCIGILERDLGFFQKLLDQLFGLSQIYASKNLSQNSKSNELIKIIMEGYFREIPKNENLTFCSTHYFGENLMHEKMQLFLQNLPLLVKNEKVLQRFLVVGDRLIAMETSEKKGKFLNTDDMRFLTTLVLTREKLQINGLPVYLNLQETACEPCVLKHFNINSNISVLIVVKQSSDFNEISMPIYQLVTILFDFLGDHLLKPNEWRRIESYSHRIFEVSNKMGKSVMSYIDEVFKELEQGLSIIHQSQASLLHTNLRSNTQIDNFCQRIIFFWQKLFPSVVTSSEAITSASKEMEEEKLEQIYNQYLPQDLSLETLLRLHKVEMETLMSERCLGILYFAIIRFSTSYQNLSKIMMTWHPLADKRKSSKSTSYDLLYSSHASPSGQQADDTYLSLIAEADEVMNDLRTDSPLIEERGNHVIIRQSFSRGEIFNFESVEKEDEKFLKILTIHHSIIPHHLIFHHQQTISNCFIHL